MTAYYRDPSGFEHPLPKLTLALAQEADAAGNEADLTEKTKRLYTFVKKVLPKEYLAEALDGKTVATIDISALANVYTRIQTAYGLEMEQGEQERLVAQVQTLQPYLEQLPNIERIIETGNLMREQRDGFQRVK